MRRLTLTTTHAHRGARLDAVLAAWLPHALGQELSRASLRRLVMAGAIRAGGRPLRRPGHLLESGTRLEALIDLDRLASSVPRDAKAVLTQAQILYEDAVLIAVDKPPGLPMHPTADSRRPHLFGLVRELLARRGSEGPGREPYLGVHHRLDRDTSGVALFTKDPAANPPLAALFASHAIVKTYHALTARPLRRSPPETWRSAQRLAATGRRGRPVVSAADGGLAAETDFAILEAFHGGLLVSARPRTGRKHQVRVHLAEAGLPILGDAVYGGARRAAGAEAPRVMLHAQRLALPHPLTGVGLVVDSPYPDDFRRLLDALRNAGAAVRKRAPRR